MARCYDKYEACRMVSAAGLDVPATWLASDPGAQRPPLVLKPRCGSDSIGVRLLRRGPVPRRTRTEAYVLQERVLGAELTVAVLGERVGIPLRIELPEGKIYSFSRKYLWRPGRGPLPDPRLAERVREAARAIAASLEVDWAARIDLIHETATDRLRFLECDVAPLVGAQSAFAASLAAAGFDRATQLEGLLT
jgi:glutathione synthase/RimK-type ligase-like ATP-grasp enzyme